MTVSAEVLGVAEMQAWAADLGNAFTRAAASEVLAESETTSNEVQAQMPVLTGWAQSTWGDTAMPGGIWEISDNGLSIEQGADRMAAIGHYEYIIKLNEGSSQQAPAGFIDVAAERGGDRLEARLNEIADMVE
jgi:hypothetical protein